MTRLCLASWTARPDLLHELAPPHVLDSFYYLRNCTDKTLKKLFAYIKSDKCKTFILDSGAFTYMESAKVNDIKNAMNGIENVIALCGEDVTRDGLQETPFRVVKAFMEYTEGYREDPQQHLSKTFDVEHDELVIVKDIEFNSMCEHHFAPFYGRVHIGYIPSKK